LYDVLGVGRVSNNSIRDAKEAPSLTRENCDGVVELDSGLLQITSGLVASLRDAFCEIRLPERRRHV
jgi:hypothetical protein